MDSRAWMIGILVIMAVICSSSLAFVSIKTAPIIERMRRIDTMSTVLDVFEIDYTADNPDDIIETFNGRIDEGEKNGLTTYTDTETGAVAVELTGSGFQGPISVVVALDGQTIKGFEVLEQDETPGLGARITEEEFKAQFEGKEVGDGIAMARGDAGPSEFDAITGATETSRALANLMDKGLKTYFGN